MLIPGTGEKRFYIIPRFVFCIFRVAWQVLFSSFCNLPTVFLNDEFQAAGKTVFAECSIFVITQYGVCALVSRSDDETAQFWLLENIECWAFMQLVFQRIDQLQTFCFRRCLHHSFSAFCRQFRSMLVNKLSCGLLCSLNANFLCLAGDRNRQQQ